MNTEMLYSDSLVEIMSDEIVFKRYYVPFGGSKAVRLTDIERIMVERPTLWNG